MSPALDAVRRPEYTGENRCTPCTIVNAVVALTVAGAIGWLTPWGPVGSAALGGGVLAVSVATIWLRGYLVPYTPYLTRTYLPDRVLQYFEHGEPSASAHGTVDPITVLDGAGALTECEDADDLCLTSEFHAAWRARIEAVREADTSRSDLGAVLDYPPEALSFKAWGEAFIALLDSEQLGATNFTGRRRVGRWESEGAFIADMAGASVIRERYDGWSGLSPDQRGQVLNGLRVFLDACPSCDGGVRFGEETVQSCCRSKEVVAVTCEDCGDRLFEAEPPEAA